MGDQPTVFRWDSNLNLMAASIADKYQQAELLLSRGNRFLISNGSPAWVLGRQDLLASSARACFRAIAKTWISCFPFFKGSTQSVPILCGQWSSSVKLAKKNIAQSIFNQACDSKSKTELAEFEDWIDTQADRIDMWSSAIIAEVMNVARDMQKNSTK